MTTKTFFFPPVISLSCWFGKSRLKIHPLRRVDRLPKSGIVPSHITLPGAGESNLCDNKIYFQRNSTLYWSLDGLYNVLNILYFPACLWSCWGRCHPELPNHAKVKRSAPAARAVWTRSGADRPQDGQVRAQRRCRPMNGMKKHFELFIAESKLQCYRDAS